MRQLVELIPLVMVSVFQSSLIAGLIYVTRRIWFRDVAKPRTLTPRILILYFLVLVVCVALSAGIIAYGSGAITAETIFFSPHSYCNYPNGPCPPAISYSKWRELIVDKYRGAWTLGYIEHGINALVGSSGGCITRIEKVCDVAGQLPVMGRATELARMGFFIVTVTTFILVVLLIHRAMRYKLFSS